MKVNGADGFLIDFKETFQGFNLYCDTAYVKPGKVQPLEGCATTDLTSIRSNIVRPYMFEVRASLAYRFLAEHRKQLIKPPHLRLHWML